MSSRVQLTIWGSSVETLTQTLLIWSMINRSINIPSSTSRTNNLMIWRKMKKTMVGLLGILLSLLLTMDSPSHSTHKFHKITWTWISLGHPCAS